MKIEKFSSKQTTDYSVAVNTIKEAIHSPKLQKKPSLTAVSLKSC